MEEKWMVYAKKADFKGIAERFGMTQDHVSVVLCRTRKKLKSCFIKEGYLYAQK